MSTVILSTARASLSQHCRTSAQHPEMLEQCWTLTYNIIFMSRYVSQVSKCSSRGFNWNHAGWLRKVQPVSMGLWVIRFSCTCCFSAMNSPAVLAHYNDILSETPGPSPRPSSMDLISSYWLGWDWNRVFWESPHGGHISALNLG